MSTRNHNEIDRYLKIQEQQKAIAASPATRAEVRQWVEQTEQLVGKVLDTQGQTAKMVESNYMLMLFLLEVCGKTKQDFLEWASEKAKALDVALKTKSTGDQNVG